MTEDGGETPSDQPRRPDAAERRGNPDRVNAFTDGVFAIIITILVLEIAVPPDLADQSLRDALGDVGPTLMAWVISFLITGMYWAWHRDLFNQIRLVNRQVVWLNLVFLLPAALIPFAASVLGEYHDDAVALHVYGAVLIAASVARVILYLYVMRSPQLLWEPPTEQSRRLGTLLTASPIAVYLAAMLVADALPTLSLLLYLSVPLLYFLLITILRRRPETREEAEDFS